MTLLLGAVTIGLILALLALGVYLSFRIFNFPDITAEGSITLGASVTATLLVRGWGPATATAAGFAGGLVAGAITGLLHTKCRINGLLSGILVMTALYSVNLHVMGKSNVPLLNEVTLATKAEHLGTRLAGSAHDLNVFGWAVGVSAASMLLVGTASLGLLSTGAVIGSVLFRVLVAIALRWGLNPNDLKLITALFVFVALVAPQLLRRLKRRRVATTPTGAS